MVEGKPLLVAGLSKSYTHETSAGIPAQWQEFGPHIGHIPGQANGCAYGVLCNGDDEGNYDYLCGVEVGDFSSVPKEMPRLRIPEQRYAVFAHRGHVSEIRATCSAIWSDWLPASGTRWRTARCSSSTARPSTRKPEWAASRSGFLSSSRRRTDFLGGGLTRLRPSPFSIYETDIPIRAARRDDAS